MNANDVLESLNQLRLSNTNCDVIFEVGAKSFPAHRVVLMARLEHFRNMFTADMREKKELTVQFDPLIIDPDCFGEVLNYIYTLKIDFTNENILAVYKTADYFCFDELTTKAAKRMKNSLYVENVVLYRNFSAEFNLESLEADCKQFIIDSSSAVSMKSQLIPEFSLEDLRDFTDALKENGKFEDMFDYSVDWVLHDEANRIGMLSELLKNIPEKSLPSQFIKRKVSNHSVFSGSDCLELQLDTLELNKSSDDTQSETLYVIGGLDDIELSSVSRYNSVTRRWTATTPMPSRRSGFGCAVIGHKIYACGGYDGEYHEMNELIMFDAHAQTWTQLTPMKHAGGNCAAAVLNGHIYVAGGIKNDETLAVVERYNVQTGRWQDVAPLTLPRSGLELVELNGFLYAIGGIDKEDDDQNSVTRYDPQTDEWENMSGTCNRYNSFGSAVLNGKIYIANRRYCEMYHPEEDEWIEMPILNKCAFGKRLAVYNSRIYAIGGDPDSESEDWKGSKTVEVFDFEAKAWQSEPDMDMDVARCLHGVAVVKH